MPQAKLLEYLTGISNDLKPNQTPGMDCSVVATRHAGLFTISTTDFFYPNVEDPYAQGRVAACNVLSDLFANGVVEVDTMLMLLATSSDMEERERDAATTALIRGFNDTCRAAGTSVTGGQTVSNPWPIIGGVASATVAEREIIRPEGARPGDVLVLTKPLGTQMAVNVWQWRPGTERSLPRWPRIAHVVDEEAAAVAYDTAVESMGRLNQTAARLMHVHGATAATDVTGFGLLGHASNLAAHTTASVTMRIHTLPIIARMAAVDAALDGGFKLRLGRSAETSGGLLVALPSRAAAEAYISDLQAADGAPAWIIGDVTAAPEGTANAAEIAADAAVIEVGLTPCRW